MTQQKTMTKGLIGVILEPVKIYRSEGKSTCAHLRLNALQVKKDDDETWQVISKPYMRLVHIYGEMVSCVEHLKVGDRLEIHGYKKDELWVDDGLTRQSTKFVMRAIRLIKPDVPAAA